MSKKLYKINLVNLCLTTPKNISFEYRILQILNIRRHDFTSLQKTKNVKNSKTKSLLNFKGLIQHSDTCRIIDRKRKICFPVVTSYKIFHEE